MPVFSYYFNTSLCVMVSVIITSERRFALSSKVVKQVLCDILCTRQRDFCSALKQLFLFQSSSSSKQNNKKKRYWVSFLKSSSNFNPKMKLCTNQGRTSLKFQCLCFAIENETRRVFLESFSGSSRWSVYNFIREP